MRTTHLCSIWGKWKVNLDLGDTQDDIIAFTHQLRPTPTWQPTNNNSENYPQERHSRQKETTEGTDTYRVDDLREPNGSDKLYTLEQHTES